MVMGVLEVWKWGCSRYGNMGRMHVVLNGEPLEEVDCFSTWGRK